MLRSDLFSHGAGFVINTDRMLDEIDEEIFADAAAGSDDEDSFDDNIEAKSPWLKSFDELKKTMVKIPNELIYKRILTEGTGDVMGQKKCRVHWAYNMFFEHEKNAFSSSYMDKKTTQIVKYDGVLQGVWIAFETMKKGEESQFIIDYSLMYGKIGCPPRIKPKADILIVIKMINFVEIGDENACENVLEEDRHKFSVMKVKVSDQQKRANDHYANKRFNHAKKVNMDAIKNLELCQVNDDKEQNEQQNMLIELYTNVCNCYMKLEDWKKVCLMINELRRLTNVKKNVELLVNEAIAQSKINDQYEASISLLRQAQKIEPNNKRVNEALIDMLEANKKYKEQSRNMWQRAFQHKQAVDKQRTADEKEFLNKFSETLKLMDGPSGSRKIPLIGWDKKELTLIEEVLSSDLKHLKCALCVNQDNDGNTIFTIEKLN